jgi:hypothetical protein
VILAEKTEIGLALQKRTNDMRKPGVGKSRQNLLFTYPWGKKCVFLSAAISLTFPYGSLCSALQELGGIYSLKE